MSLQVPAAELRQLSHAEMTLCILETFWFKTLSCVSDFDDIDYVQTCK